MWNCSRKNEDAGELVANGAVHQRGHHGGVHAAREGENDLARANLLADLLDLLVDDALHGPVLLEVAHAKQEILEHARAILGVAHLGVELRGEEAAAWAFHNGNGAGVRAAGDHEALGRAAHGVAVAHPHRLATLRRAVEKHRGAKARERSRTVLALVGVRDLAAKLDGHDLLAIAEAQDGDAELEDAGVHVGRALGVDGGGATRKDDRGWSHLRKLVRRDVAGDNLRIDVQVTDPTSNELPVLGTKVEDRHELLGPCLGHARLPSPASAGQNAYT